MRSFGIHLLVVEDNDDDYRILRRILSDQPAGYAVNYGLSRVASLEAALYHMTYKAVDIVLLDLNLEDSSGLDTFNAIAAQKSPIPIVVTTGQAQADTGVYCMGHGAAAYLVKDWIAHNPALLNITLLYLYDLARKQSEIHDFIQERLGNFQPLIPRCPYCQPRIGYKRWRDEATDTWLHPDEYMKRFHIQFTDGICPDCAQEIKDKLPPSS